LNGLWAWELEHVKEGVIDVTFDVTPPATTESGQTIELTDGEYAIFGFGSLLSIASIERTIGRRYNGPFLSCELLGWKRSWDCAMPNTTFIYRDRGAWQTPEKILYLNMHQAPGQNVNGIIFVVGEAELAKLDEREWVYERVNVVSSLKRASVHGGPLWAYVARQENVLAPPESPIRAAVRKSYLKILDDGHRDLGPEFAARYFDTSDPVPQHLVVDDHRRNEVY
jgi:cation transport regulator ChaC